MKSISEPFIRRPVMTILLSMAAIVFGILCYKRLPVSDLPNVDYPVIQVMAAYPGADPETMAANVATPLEKEFLKIQGLELATSENVQGISFITLQFSLDKNIDSAALDVQSAIQRSAYNLPNDMPSPPIFEKTDPNSQPIFFIAITSATVPSSQLYEYASAEIAQRFNVIQGVSKSDVYGLKRAVRIAVDPEKLHGRGLTMDEIARQVQAATATVGAGTLHGEHRSWIIKADGQLNSAMDYANIVLGNADGTPVYLRDVAECSEGLESSTFHTSFWSRELGECDAAVVMAVSRAAGANTVAVAKQIQRLIPEIRSQLPESVHLTTIYDRSKTIMESIRDVQESIIIAFVLVGVVIFFFLGRVRDTVIPIIALPMSLLILFAAMYLLGFGLDNLSLMGITLAVGFLVDDAIVFLENMVRRMQKLGEDPHMASINGAGEISPTIISMTLSLISIFLPLFFLGGQIGRVFHEFAAVIMVATLASGVISLSVTPLMCARMLKRRDASDKTRLEIFSERLEESFLKIYDRALHFFLSRKAISLAIWGLCLLGTGFCFVKLPKTFIPDGDSGNLRGIFIAQEGTSPKSMQEYQHQIDNIIRAHPSVSFAFSVSGIDFFPSNQGMIIAFLNPASERAKIQTISNELTGQLFRVPGAMAFLRPSPALQISTGAMSTNQGKYAYTISGIEPSGVYEAAQKMLTILRGNTSLASVSSDLFLSTPEVRVSMCRDQISAYGTSVRAIESQYQSAFSENYIYLIKAPTQQYQVILGVADSFRSKASDLDLIYYRGNGGHCIDPSTVTRWDTGTGALTVNHTNNFPCATIFFDLKPGVAIGTVIDQINALAKDILQNGLMGSFQGEAASFTATFASLKILIFAAIFVTFIILGILYESYMHPITVLSALPVAAFGGLGTLLILRQELSLYAYIGLFMLLGLVEKNGIMIIDFALMRQREGMSPRDAIHCASMQRFRPIIMTTLATIMGVIPMALGWGADGASRRPLGLVIIGGMVFAQVITLFITPVIYLCMDTFQSRVLDKISFFKRGEK
ncbi:MAG: efflux RND transporter permease subunit [Puniceicoccales bacterium]|jgi:HAE1 family hydrophobic/amphiphilic exporter-1|nr:efflux RND transporter permease subunit [Puniceicoccales bacterium]